MFPSWPTCRPPTHTHKLPLLYRRGEGPLTCYPVPLSITERGVGHPCGELSCPIIRPQQDLGPRKVRLCPPEATVGKKSLTQHRSPAHLICQHLELHVVGGLGLAQVEDEASSCQGPYL